MKGIVLAGGSGTRLFPATRIVSKQLLPVYDKPMIYYPLSVLMLGGIREILVVSTPEDTPRFQRLLGDGTALGMRIQFAVQPQPRGLADALNVAADFVAGQPVCLILGDNLFYGQGLTQLVRDAIRTNAGATIFVQQVKDPDRSGVVTFGAAGEIAAYEEKPARPKSNWAVTGFFLYDETVCARARELSPSSRGELEITELNQGYWREGRLRALRFGRGYAWIDAGTHESLLEAGVFVRTIEQRTGMKIACLEEIAWTNGWIGRDEVRAAADLHRHSDYGAYLRNLVADAP